jgi:hypothetical protein
MVAHEIIIRQEIFILLNNNVRHLKREVQVGRVEKAKNRVLQNDLQPLVASRESARRNNKGAKATTLMVLLCCS